MAFCPSCGAQVEGNFCGTCGKPVGSAQTPGAASYQPAPGATGMQENLASALCYLLGLITGVLFLVLEPYNKNPRIRFHAFQSIFLNIALVVVAIGLSILGAVMGTIIPIIGHLMTAMVGMVIWIGSIVLWLVLLIKTYNGGKIVLPIIGPLAQKQAG
jgi:uncharacterized membrane protein